MLKSKRVVQGKNLLEGGAQWNNIELRIRESDIQAKILNDALKQERTAWLESFPDLDPAIKKALGEREKP